MIFCHDQSVIMLCIDHKLSICDLRMVKLSLCKHILWDNVIICLSVIKDLRCFSAALHVSCPVGFAIIKDCRMHLMCPVCDQFTYAVHIFHQLTEMTILRIVSVCIKMWRAVRIRELFCGKCMRYIVVYTAYHKVVCQIFFQLYALFPAVVAKDFAHGIAMLVWLDRSRG